MQADAKTIVLARALVEEDVEVRRERLQPIEVRVGEAVTLRFVYHITEDSPLKDAWRMTLKTRFEGKERVAANEHLDHLIIKDEVWDCVEVTYVFTQPGSEAIAFEAAAEMERSAWVGRTRRPTVLANDVRGTVAIMVLP